MRLLASMFLPALVALPSACGGEIGTTPDTEDEGLVDLALSSVAPTEGPATGGTELVVSGAGFTEATAVRVGEEACGALTRISSAELACVTAGGAAGPVAVTVSRGEDGATVAGSFTYVGEGADEGGGEGGGEGGDEAGDEGGGEEGGDEAGDEGGGDEGGADEGGDGSDTADTAVPTEPVDYCHLQWPCTTTVSSGGTTEALYAWVYEAGLTEGAGEGTGVQVEFGYGPDGTNPADGGWTFSAGSYLGDKDGLSAGDLANDEHTGTLTVTAASGSYDTCARASVDGGASWLYCDLGGDGCSGSGSDDGYSSTTSGSLEVQ